MYHHSNYMHWLTMMFTPVRLYWNPFKDSWSDKAEQVVGGIEEVPDQKVKVAFMQLGESRIELLQSTTPDGPVAKFIEKRGQGIQHIAIGVDNIENELAELSEKGVRLIDEKPRIGAGGAKIAFVHPKSTRGVLLEICQR